MYDTASIMQVHCGCNSQLLWSEDGVQWVVQGKEQSWCSGFNYTGGGGGGEGHVATRQRPKWIVDKAGAATHLTTGVNRPGDSSMGHCWTMAAKLV